MRLGYGLDLPPDSIRELDLAKQGGAGVVRFPITAALGPELDAVIAAVRARGLSMVPVMLPTASEDPADHGLFASRCGQFAARYGPAVMEIWNEQNTAYFWGQSFDAYCDLFRQARAAIPDGCKILVGGLFCNAGQVDWLRRFEREVGGSYEWSAHYYRLGGQTRIAETMLAQHDALAAATDRPIWVTEAGTSSLNGLDRQRDVLDSIYRGFEKRGVQTLAVYRLRDFETEGPFVDYGVVSRAGVLKPAYHRLKALST